jgi:hypothetical protein
MNPWFKVPGALLVGIVAATMSGCGDDDDAKTMTLDTPEGKVKVQAVDGQDAGKVTFEGPEGKVVQSGANDGMKIVSTDKDGKTFEQTYGKANLKAFEGITYPGAEAVDGAGATIAMGGSTTTTASFTSADSVEKVIEHYKKLFPKATSFTAGPMTNMSLVGADGASFSIVIMAGEGTEKTQLTLTAIKKP